MSIAVAAGAALGGHPGHGRALGILVVHVLTEEQVKAAVKETKKKVEKKADKAEKVLLFLPLAPLPLSPPIPPFRGSWSAYRGCGYMATKGSALARDHGCTAEGILGPPSATVAASSPSHNIPPFTT